MQTIQVFSLPFFLVSIVVFSIGILSILKTYKLKENFPFFLFCFSLGLWAFFSAISYNTDLQIWNKLVLLFTTTSVLTSFYFCCRSVHLKNNSGIFYFLIYCASMLALGDWLQNGNYWPKQLNFLQPHFFSLVLTGYWALVLAYSLFKIYCKILEEKNSTSTIEYNKAWYLLLCNGLLASLIIFSKMPNSTIFNLAENICLLGAALSSYSITLTPRLMPDISFLTRKSADFVCGLLVVLGFSAAAVKIYFLLQQFSFVFSGFLYAAVLSFLTFKLLQWLYLPTLTLLHKLCFPIFYSREKNIEILTKRILQSTDKKQLNDNLKELFISIFKCSGASFFLWEKEKNAYVLQSNFGSHHFFVSQMETNYILPKFLAKKNYLSIHDNLYINGENFSQESQDLLSVFYQNHISLCVPIISKHIHFSLDPQHTTLSQENERDKYLIGFFIFKEKLSGLSYNLEEVRHLQDLSQYTETALQSLQLGKVTDIFTSSSQDFPHKQETPTLRNYFPTSIASEVLNHMQTAKAWNGKKHHAVILMFDLRGFTSMFEDNKAEEVVEWLNEYFKEMIETISSFGGTIDKFLGDGGLVVFAESNNNNPEYQAALCSLEMQKSLNNLNKKRTEKNLAALHMGIAIASGEVMSGNIGSEKHMEYTVIGDPVNLASRLQAIAKSGQIIATETIKDQIEGKIKFKEYPSAQIKGKAHRIKIIEIQKESNTRPRRSAKIVPNKAIGY